MPLHKSRKRHQSATETSAASSAPSPPAASSPSPPSPPSSSSVLFIEDPISPFTEFDFVDDNLIHFYRSQWSSIRTNRRSGRIQTTYNIRLDDLNRTTLHPTLWNIFKSQSSAFKINLSFGFILRNKISGELRYFHSSRNVSMRPI